MATVARIRELLQLLKFVSAQCAPTPPPPPPPPHHPPPPPTPPPTPHPVLSFSSSIPCRKFVSPYQGEATAAARAVLPGYTHSYKCVQYYCVHTLVHGCQRQGCLTCAQMLLLRVIEHGGRTSAIRQSALKVDSVEKNPPATACHGSDCSCGREINNSNKTATRAVLSHPCMHLPMHNCMYTR